MYSRELLGISQLIADERLLQRLCLPVNDNEVRIISDHELYDSNFIQRMLYKNLYWLIDWQFSTLIYVFCCILYNVSRVELRSVNS